MSEDASDQLWDEHLRPANDEIQAAAADAVNSFIRDKLREDAFARKIIPPDTLRMDELWVGTVGVRVQVKRDGRWIAGTVVARAAFVITIDTDENTRITADVDEERVGCLKLYTPSHIFYDKWKENDGDAT